MVSNLETMVDGNSQNIEMRETFAIINYFRLKEQVLLSNLYTNGYNADIDNKSDYKENLFRLLGGVEFLDRLILDCKEENIDIFSNTQEQLVEKLEKNLGILKDSLPTEDIKMIEFMIKKYKYWQSNNSISYGPCAYTTLVDASIPISRNKRIEWNELKPKQKKIV